MKRFLAIAIAIAVLLAPIYSLNAAAVAGFEVEKAWTVTTAYADTVAQVENGIQLKHFGGFWFFQDQESVSRVAFGTLQDPTNFEMKFSIDTVVDRLAKAPFPWGGAGYDSWINVSLIDSPRVWNVTDGKLINGIVMMVRIEPTNADGDNNSNISGHVFIDGNEAWQDKYDQKELDVDPLGATMDLKFVRDSAGKYILSCNDVVCSTQGGWNDYAALDRAFFKGSWYSQPIYDAMGQPQYKQFSYPAVSAVGEVAEAGKLYQPAITYTAAYNGPELVYFTPRAEVPAVTTAAAYWTMVVHPAVTAAAEVKEPGKTYVPAVTTYAGTIGPEWHEIPAVTAFDGVPAILTPYTSVKYVTTVNPAGATTYVPANQIYTTPVYNYTLDSAGKKVLKDIYLKVTMSSAVVGEMAITIKELNGKSFFKDMTPPVISGVTNGGYFNNPTITVTESGEGVLGKIWTNCRPDVKGHESDGWSELENGSMITTEGNNWVGAWSNGTDWANVYFTVDSTNPTLDVTANGVAVKDKSTVTGPVKVLVSDTNLMSKAIYSPSGKKITWPSSNTFSAKSTYRLVAVDKAGNISTLVFTIK